MLREANGAGPVTAVFDGAGQRVANKAGGVLNIMVYDAVESWWQHGATAPTTANPQYDGGLPRLDTGSDDKFRAR